jgi:hypothetical protein
MATINTHMNLEDDVRRLDNLFNATQSDDDIARWIVYLLEGKSLKVLETVQGSLDDFRGVQEELIERGIVGPDCESLSKTDWLKRTLSLDEQDTPLVDEEIDESGHVNVNSLVSEGLVYKVIHKDHAFYRPTNAGRGFFL